MFEDETVAIACPNCGHKNHVLVRDPESTAETMVVCSNCHKTIKIELEGFHRHLDQVRAELDAIQHDAAPPKKKPSSSSKDDYQI